MLWLTVGTAVLSVLLAGQSHAQDAQLAHWTVGAPDLSVGVVEGEGPYVLAGVHDVLGLSDGRIVVVLLSRNLFEMRFFDSRGKYLKTVGRFGDGPFEVGMSGLCCVMRLSGDSLLVLRRDGRFAVFDSRGKGVRTGRLAIDKMPIAAAVVLGDTLATIEFVGEERGRRFFEERVVYSLALGPGDVDSLATGIMRQSVGVDRGVVPRPFPVGARLAAGGGVVWFGNGGEGAVWRSGVHGVPELFVESAGFPRQPVTDERKAHYRQAYYGGLGEHRRREVNEMVEDADFPDELPGFQDLATDSDDNLWVMAYEPRWSEEPYRFRVYDRTGAEIATASVPWNKLSRCLRTSWDGWCAAKVYDIHPNYILARVEDDLGVEHVVRYPLLKTEPSPQD